MRQFGLPSYGVRAISVPKTTEPCAGPLAIGGMDYWIARRVKAVKIEDAAVACS